VNTPIRVFILTAVLSLAACNSARPGDERPDWVNGNAAQYPAAAYLTGHGQSDNMAVAKDRARADLAKNFTVDVSEQSNDKSSFSQGDANGAATSQNSLDVSRNISTRTEQALSGVEISQTWEDPKSLQFYALATLSRAKAGAALRQQIGDLDAGTAAALNQARGSSDLFDKISAATQAVDSQQTRAGLQKELQVVDQSGMGIPSSWSLAKLQADRAALLKQLQIAPAADGRDADALKKVLAGALSDSGFTVADGANYTMTADLKYADLPPQGGWYWISGTLQVSMDGADKRAHGVRRWDLKVSGSNKQLAQQRLMDQVTQYLQHDIQGTVLAFASGRQP
jgi:LPP20 lipoprotein